MTRNDLLIHPASQDTTDPRLILLLHGVGSDATSMAPLGRYLAEHLPDAHIVCLQGPYAGDGGRGRQWFSIAGVTEENRPERVAQALPDMISKLSAWQNQFGATPARTVLIGFSQGAIMALSASAQSTAPAHTVVALAGRFPRLPHAVAVGVRFHIIHGLDDPVIAPQHGQSAAEHLSALGAQVSLDLLPRTGHSITREMAQVVCSRLD